MAIQGHTQIWKLGKESQNLVGRYYPIHVKAPN
jgi:hypothetical protein